MRTDIGVQNPVSYAIWPMIILAVIIAGIIGYAIVNYFLNKKKKKRKPKPVVVRKPPLDISVLKRKYLDELESLRVEFTSEKIDLREGFQQMSSIIRHFVFEATGI